MISMKRKRHVIAFISPELQDWTSCTNIHKQDVQLILKLIKLQTVAEPVCNVIVSRQLFTKWRQRTWIVTTTLVSVRFAMCICVCVFVLFSLLFSVQTLINLYITALFHVMKPRNLHDFDHSFCAKANSINSNHKLLWWLANSRTSILKSLAKEITITNKSHL